MADEHDESVSHDLPVLVIDGANFDDFEGFRAEFSSLLTDFEWNGNPDAFNDILRGGFGTPAGGFILRWQNAERSRAVLGYPATVAYLEDKLEGAHESATERVAEELEQARRAEGPTLFDLYVEIIKGHEPGGREGASNLHLQLA